MRAGPPDAEPPPGGYHGGEDLLRRPEGDECAGSVEFRLR
uniref:Pdh2 n=1 Tax=Arundo donax TaxID=35708 RepID=A0A0A9S990_ARUDO